MHGGFVELVEESRSLNSGVFSLVRLQLLSSLAFFGLDGASYRELKAALQLSDGALYSNLKALSAVGYVSSKTVNLEGKKLECFQITVEGLKEWNRVREWLCKFLACEVRK